MTVDGIATTNVTKKQGQEVELLCIVEYSNELQTSISWKMETLAGVTSVANRTFQTNLTGNAVGNYTFKVLIQNQIYPVVTMHCLTDTLRYLSNNGIAPR